MLSWLRKKLSGSKLQDMELEFTVDLTEDGKHLLKACQLIEGERVPPTSIAKLWTYGSKFEINGKRYKVSAEDFDTLGALRSLNPQPNEDGSLVFDVYPSVLSYLRTRPRLKESEKAKELRVSKEPLKPMAQVDYQSGHGLIVKTGWGASGLSRLVHPKEVVHTEDGKHIRIGNCFFPAPKKPPPEVERFLENPEIAVHPDEIPEFFKRDLVLLKTKLGAVLTDEAQSLKVIEKSFTPSVSITTDNKGWLDFDIGYTVEGYRLPHNLCKALKGRHARPNEKTWIKIDSGIVASTDRRLCDLGAEETEQGYRLPVMKFTSLEEFIEVIGGKRIVSEAYNEFLSQLTSFDYNENFHLPAEVEEHLLSAGIELRPYQRAGIHWLDWLRKHHLHGILADDMGLGKTIQTISAIHLGQVESDASKHSLIVCPKSVVHFWARELKRCIPGVRVFEHVGSHRNRTSFASDDSTFFITTYDTLLRDIDDLRAFPFQTVVLDEATHIKNPNTKRTRAVKELNSARRIALTGTPIENTPSELWSIFDFLMRGHLGSYAKFMKEFQKPILANDAGAADRLGKRIRPFTLRRLKKDVADDLPEKIELDEWVQLTEEQATIYAQLQEREINPILSIVAGRPVYTESTHIFTILTRLKQLCDHPAILSGQTDPLFDRSEKFDFAMQRLQDIALAGEKAVIFSHFLETLNLLEMACRERGITYIRLDGSTQNRQNVIDDFNNGSAQAALCSLKACGQGITMTAANHVIHLDRWWNPAIEDQATDRIHRIGQDKTVYVYRILVQNTLEERIAKILEEKRGISDRVIGGQVGEDKRWTREELMEILQPF